jgi:hypothetical protein
MSTGNRFPVPTTPEERAEFVASAFEACGSQIAVYVKELRCDFRALRKTGGTLMECRTWTEFCRKVLKRTTRAVRYICAGGNPRWKRKPSTDDWKNHWVGMPDFEQHDDTPFKTIYVHFENQECVDKFAELVGQQITPKTRFIWYPRAQRASFIHIRYVQGETDEAAA